MTTSTAPTTGTIHPAWCVGHPARDGLADSLHAGQTHTLSAEQDDVDVTVRLWRHDELPRGGRPHLVGQPGALLALDGHFADGAVTDVFLTPRDLRVLAARLLTAAARTDLA